MEEWSWLQHIGAGNLTAGALLGLFILLVLTGRIVPASTVRRLLEREAQRGDDWREAFQTEQANGRLQSEQNRELLEHSRTTARLLEALRTDAATRAERAEGRTSVDGH